MNQRMEQLADQLLMLRMGSYGHSRAHMLLQDLGAIGRHDREMSIIAARRKDRAVRIFVPPEQEDRVLMFSDNSGVYVYSDGLCTIMGVDIAHEIVQWQEIRG